MALRTLEKTFKNSKICFIALMKNKGSDLKYINKSRNEGTQKSTAILNATGSRYCPAYLQTETGLRKNRRNTEFL